MRLYQMSWAEEANEVSINVMAPDELMFVHLVRLVIWENEVINLIAQSEVVYLLFTW